VNRRKGRGFPVRMRIVRVGLLTLSALTTMSLLAAVAEAQSREGKAVQVELMTRNIFLGADLGPALRSTSFHPFIEANGGILREVDETNFPLRAQGLAEEIKQKKPDLIGLQEVAWWRTGPVAIPPAITGGPFGAVTTEYDFLEILLDELEARGMSYDPAVVKDEFDFEAPADENDVDNDAPPGLFNPDPTTDDEGPASLDDAELNGRLTMRDVILVNEESNVNATLSNPQTGTFANLFTPTVAGIVIPVTRGWTAGDVTVSLGQGRQKVEKSFRFVNTHFEAFDDETQVPSIRAQQAAELVAGPASPERTIILGDFNSDVPGVQPGDEQAFQTLLDAGFERRATSDPLSCCVSDLFNSPPSEFDHQVDHIVTNMGDQVELVNSTVTGLSPVNGIYNSDHAGVYSKLKLR
jgi:endonuclease/exonuclease/phosphatase family metal-dependent hydrolase